MSPHSAGSSRAVSPDRAVITSQNLQGNNGQSPPEEVDFVPDPSQTAQQGRARNASAKLQGMLSTNSVTLTSNDPAPWSRRDQRGANDLFKFAPAPRHPPGHFTNRKIVPRTDGPEPHQTHDRPAVPPSFNSPKVKVVRMTDGHTKQPERPKKIGLPFAKKQPRPATNAEVQTSPDTAEQLTQGPVQAVQPRQLSHSPHQPAQSPTSTTDHTASKDTGVVHPPITEPQLIVTKAVSAVPEAGNVQMVPRQLLGDAMERYEGQELAVSASAGSPRPVIGLTKNAITNLPSLIKRHSNPKQSMRDHQAIRPRRSPQHHHKYRRTPHGKDDTISPSISSSSSSVSKRKTRPSTLDLNLFRDRELPEVANKMNNFYKLCNDVVVESQRKADKYQEKLHSVSQKLTNCLDTLNVQGQSLQEFEHEKQDMRDRIGQLEQQVRAYSDKLPKLVDKCRAVKDTLASALRKKQELLELHNHYKKESDDAIQEIRAEKQREQSLRELIDRQFTALREQMKAKIRQVELQSQEECRCMQEKVQLLSQQLKEKESQLSRERDIADQLTKHLGESRETQSSLEDVRTHTSEIIKMLGKRQEADSIGRVLQAQEQSRAKLESTAEQLEFLRALLMPHCEVTATIGKKQDEGQSQIMSTLQTMYKAQCDSRENDDLKAQLATKCSIISGLEAKLKAQDESHEAEVGSLTQKISKLTDLMNERDEASTLAVEKAVATVQDGCRAKLQRREEEMREHLQQAREERQLAVAELGEFRKKLENREEAEHDTSEKLKALGVAKDEAMLRNQKLVEDLHGKEARLTTLTGAFQSIAEWASSKAAAHGLEFSVGKLWEDSGMDDEVGKRWTALLETIFKDLDIHHAYPRQAPPANVTASEAPVTVHSNRHAVSSASGLLASIPMTEDPDKDRGSQNPQPTPELHTGSAHAPGPRASSRRATVQSPHPGMLTPVPPSVEQEKSQRRGTAGQPKSIMKSRLTRSTPNASEFLIGQNGDSVNASSGSYNSKRPREVVNLQSGEALSPLVPQERDNDSINDDMPQQKRARTKAKAPASSRGKSTPATSKQSKQRAPRSGLTAPGVVHGRLRPGVVEGTQPPAPELKNVSGPAE